MNEISKYIIGFRSKTKWKMVVASIYYAICLVVLLSDGVKVFLIFLFATLILFGLITLLIKIVAHPGFKTALIAENNRQTVRKNELKACKQELQDKHIAHCPKCLSTSLSAQKKGFGTGRAVIAGKILHSATDGILVGGIGRSKMFLYCMNCGHKFKAHR